MAMALMSRCLTLALALVAFKFVSVTSEPCPIGQVWDTKKLRCAFCLSGQVKYPDIAGDESAYCRDASEVCGTAEFAQYGSCTKCGANTVAYDSRTCRPCPDGAAKVPPGIVKNAKCQYDCPHTTEVCNGRDDDCDGSIDEGLGTITCGLGACARTVNKCSKGELQKCVSGNAKAEVCNGIDDDCDGLVDEGGVCAGACGGEITCGKGACLRTVPTCINGQRQTCKPGPVKTEVCNGIDDDCDGTVDDLKIPYILCEPCNAKVPACNDGKPGSCANVCSRPCCEDCDTIYKTLDDRVACGSTCQPCVLKSECRTFATYVAVKVAEKVCTEVASRCGVSYTPNILIPGVQTRTQCYNDAYDLCTDGAVAYAKTVDPDANSDCRWYNRPDLEEESFGECSQSDFKRYFTDRLDELCHDDAVSVAVSLVSPSGH